MIIPFLLDLENSTLSESFEVVINTTKDSSWSGLLTALDHENHTLLGKFYLHDFVRSVHPTSLETSEFASMEYEVSIIIIIVRACIPFVSSEMLLGQSPEEK